MIGPEQEQLGVVVLKRAQELAQEHGLDLVEVAPEARPPVCRIMDFSKYKYDQEKKERRIKKSQKISHLRQIRVKPHIEAHDYQVKLKKVLFFLEKHDKVKVNVFFRGREMAFKDHGRKLLERFVEDTKDYGQVEKDVSMTGRIMSAVFSPKSRKS